MGCCDQTWISPPRTVVAAATCTLYESRAVNSTSALMLVTFVLMKSMSGASLSVTLPTMILSTVKVPEHNESQQHIMTGDKIAMAQYRFSSYRRRCDVMFQTRCRSVLDRMRYRDQIQEARMPIVHMPYLEQHGLYLYTGFSLQRLLVKYSIGVMAKYTLVYI